MALNRDSISLPVLVDGTVRANLYQPEADLSQVRVTEPGDCGCFLPYAI